MKVTVTSTMGVITQVEGGPGESLMQAMVRAQTPEIEAACGGSLACGTCHVYVDVVWAELLPAPSDMEREMLDCGLDVRPTSRLACQIKLDAELDGLCVSTPPGQG